MVCQFILFRTHCVIPFYLAQEVDYQFRKGTASFENKRQTTC